MNLIYSISSLLPRTTIALYARKRVQIGGLTHLSRQGILSAWNMIWGLGERTGLGGLDIASCESSAKRPIRAVNKWDRHERGAFWGCLSSASTFNSQWDRCRHKFDSRFKIGYDRWPGRAGWSKQQGIGWIEQMRREWDIEWKERKRTKVFIR